MWNKFVNWLKTDVKNNLLHFFDDVEPVFEDIVETEEREHPNQNTTQVNASVTLTPAMAPPPSTVSALPMEEVLYEIISHYNSGETKVYYPVRNDATGTLDAYIGHNDATTNKLVATTIVGAATQYNLDPMFLASVIMQESIFSPVTFNHNLSQSNLIPNFKTTDWGIAQLSGAFLPSKPGMVGLTEDEMQAKAMNPTWAIPVMASLYSELIHQATQELENDNVLAADVHKLNTTKYSDAQFLGTLAYNRGMVGGIADVKNNSTTMMAHPYHCSTWYSDFVYFHNTGVFMS